MSEQNTKTLMTLAQKDPREYALLKLMASTGFRISDIVRLRRDQLIESDGDIVRTLRVKMTKTADWIERALPDDTREAAGVSEDPARSAPLAVHQPVQED
jgi:hypothetical protein